MPLISYPSIPQDTKSVEQVVDYLIGFMRMNNDSMNHLDSLNVDELEAEKILAGKMIGFVIQTNQDNAYPNIIFSSTANLIQAFSDALNHVDMTAGAGGSPGITWTVANTLNAYLNSTVAGPLLASFNSTPITIQPSTDLNLSINSTGRLTIGNGGAFGQNASISYVKNVVAGTPSFGTMNFTKGILTSFT